MVVVVGRTRENRVVWVVGGDDRIAFVPEVGAILMHMHGHRCLEHEGAGWCQVCFVVYAKSS